MIKYLFFNNIFYMFSFYLNRNGLIMIKLFEIIIFYNILFNNFEYCFRIIIRLDLIINMIKSLFNVDNNFIDSDFLYFLSMRLFFN
jgi:hypothetical protein